MTYYYEDLKPGITERYEHGVSARDVELFGEVTGDRNPVHFDEDYARKTIFRGRVAHGVLSMGFVSAVIGMRLPGPGTIIVSAVTRFKAPVRIGDTVQTICAVKEVREKREVLLECRCLVGETVAIEAEVLVLAPKKPRNA